jgi:hypothetical protein
VRSGEADINSSTEEEQRYVCGGWAMFLISQCRAPKTRATNRRVAVHWHESLSQLLRRFMSPAG